MKLKALYILIILLGISACRNQQRLMNNNRSYTYMTGSEKIIHKVLNDKNGIKLLIKTNPENILTHYSLSFEIKENYQTPGSLYTDSISKATFKDNILEIKIPGKYRNKLFVLKLIHNTGEYGYLYDIPLKSNAQADYHLYCNNKPLPEAYATLSDTLKIHANSPGDSVFYISYYLNTFPAAAPPIWSKSKRNVEPRKDSVIKIYPEEDFIPKKPGIYFIQRDTLSPHGRSILISQNKFPSITKPDEMLGPLAYIMSPLEFENLVQQEDVKKAIDLFWLKTGGSKNYTKGLIRSFYQQVEIANILFTSYKEGWKTDKGMIYILFGVPDEVYHHGNHEEWFYYDDFNSMGNSFTFVKKNNIFCSEHYELVRKSDYKMYWINELDKWRNGILVK